MIMGKGICANSYVGKRDAQIAFARFFGSTHLPIDIQRRLERLARRKKKARVAGGQKGKN